MPRQNGSRPVYANGRISFEIDLAPGAAWHSCLLYELGDGKARFAAADDCIARSDQSKVGQRLRDWHKAVLKIRTTNEEFYRFFRQAIDDMAALRLPIESTDHMEFVPAAGVPWFVALFGRDSLIASLQNAIVYPGFTCGLSTCLDRCRPRNATTIEMRSRARSCMRCVLASSRISNWCPTRPIMAPRTRQYSISSYFTSHGGASEMSACSSDI
jgi:hypothetical protein